MRQLMFGLGVVSMALTTGSIFARTSVAGGGSSLPSGEATTQSSEGPTDAARTEDAEVDLEELSRQVEVLAEELERIRSGEPEIELTGNEARQLGLGTSAASVYRQAEGISVAGYGEMLYENFAAEDQSGADVNRGAELDFLRVVLYFGYRFNDKFLFNSEIEVEHADEIGVEFAYLDYLAHPALRARGGLVLVPMGLTNEFHEPTAFPSARRPETESRLLPSTWRENGAGVVGSRGLFSYRAYLINGLDASGFSADGLRGGRQKGSHARFGDPAFVGRIDVAPTPGVFFGGAFYIGDSSQSQFIRAGEAFSVRTTIGELHGQVQIRGFDIRGLYARASVDNADLLNEALRLTGSAGVGAAQEGGYLQMGYNVLSQLKPNVALTPFYRFETLDTQNGVAAGFLKDPEADRDYHTIGVSFNPIPNVAVKADYQWIRNEANTGVDQFNVALGYSF